MKRSTIIGAILIFSFSGCVSFREKATETLKVVWGSSTRALEEARSKAIAQEFPCSFEACWDAVVNLAQENATKTKPVENTLQTNLSVQEEAKLDPKVKALEEQQALAKQTFEIFINDQGRKFLVVMGVVGSINTTEVGIFFSDSPGGRTKIEVTSLSTKAKEKVSEMVFKELAQKYKF